MPVIAWPLPSVIHVCTSALFPEIFLGKQGEERASLFASNFTASFCGQAAKTTQVKKTLNRTRQIFHCFITFTLGIRYLF